MPALSDDKAFDNSGFDKKMLENEQEIKAGEPINSVGNNKHLKNIKEKN